MAEAWSVGATVYRCLIVAFVVVVGVALGSDDSPVDELNAHADQLAEDGARESATSNSLDKELYKRLYVKKRKEHLEAVKILKKMDKYERQYKLINVTVEKIFDVIESKRILLKDFTESDLQDVSFSTENTTRSDFKDAISSVLENIALFGDVVLNLPDITHRILKAQPKWNSTIHWSFDFLNKTKDLIDKSTVHMIHLASQELNIVEREPDYFNPNKIVKSKSSNSAESAKRSNKKKEKRKKGPTMAKYEL